MLFGSGRFCQPNRFKHTQLIDLQHITVSYPGRSAAVKDLSLRIDKGELLAIVGESGSGKTSTLKVINRLIEPASGSVLIDGIDSTSLDQVELRRSIGYVFQEIGLFPHLTIEENIGLVPTLLNWPRERIKARVNELLGLVGLNESDIGERYPAQLSGGQQQRVGLARALAARPNLLLMDEPLGALDPLTRETLQTELVSIHLQLGLTTVMVTHDIVEAVLMADRIGVMRDGVLLSVGSASELLNQVEDDYVRSLMSKPKEQADRIEDILGKAGKDRN